MKKRTYPILLSLPLTALLLVAQPPEHASRAQETSPSPGAFSAPFTGTTTTIRHGRGTATPQQAAALERARLEHGLVLAERTAQMLVSFDRALVSMGSHIQ